MRLQLAFHLIIIIVFETNLALRQFNDEYPGVTVCESTNTPGSQYHMPYSYRILKGQFGGNHNCTHVEGNLIIENIWLDSEIFDLRFLESIVEVSGMVYVKNNSIPKIILPNLRAIRGQYAMDIGPYMVSLSIDLLDEENSKYAILPNLIVISNHSVYFKTASPHKYLPQSVNWEELFEYPEHQKFISPNKYNSTEIHRCNPNCSTYFNYCWSSMEQHCQKQTKCIKQKDSCKWCYFKMRDGKMDEDCCSDQCSGGCSGMKDTDCAICKTYVNEKRCVLACPREFIAGNKRNPDFKLRVGFMCAISCPENLLQEQDACIYSCTNPKFYREGQKCLPCLNSSICDGKECNINNFINDDPSEFFMTKDILETFTNCEHVIGGFHFTGRSFNKSEGNITVSMLYKHLKNVQFITGDLLIEGVDIILRNLTFLQNLKEIRHQLTVSGTAALNIMHTDLEFLGLRKLRHIFGNFEAHENPNLCYLNTLNWNGNVLKSNSFNPVFTSCNKSCDIKCDSQGCWGPGSDMCYNCVGFRAGYNCVNQCEDSPGFYSINKTDGQTVSFQYDNGRCQPCHYLCLKNCTGPNPNDCIGGCKYFKERNICVKSCSTNYFSSDGRNCYKCNEACGEASPNEPKCTGNGSFLGLGGCSVCNRFIYKVGRPVECYKETECQIGYYMDVTSLSRFINRNVSKEVHICWPCLDPCSMCSGNSTNRFKCTKCKGFWSGDNCVKECFPVAPNLSINDNCPYCNNDCVDGCNVPSNYSFICDICNHKRVYTNKQFHMYQCLKDCPSNRTYEYREEDSKDMVCVTKFEYDEYIKSNNFKSISKWTIVLIVLLIIASLFLSLFVVLYLNKINRRKSLKYLKAIYSNIHEPDSRIILINRNTIPNMNRLLLIQNTDLVFNINDKPLGTGAFGAVYHGFWKSSCESRGKIETNTIDVAIKVIKSNKNIDINEILEEAKVMASVSHKHCLRLIGICLKREIPCLVTAFMELGSLDKYLRKHKPDLSSYILLSWGEQIANGMAYLEMRGIIHRDLAARNVLLNNLQLVQITDFGLAHILQSNEDNDNNNNHNNEIVITGGLVPIRWLALETLLNGVYSHKTDVWAYGVTLWEIFTYGERPYDDMEMREVPSYLIENNRLPQPEICSINVYELMIRCWDINPNFRPPFEELMTTLSYFTRYPTYYLNITNDPSLRLQKSDKRRLLSQNSYDFSGFIKSKDIYKQQSMDGTISTFITEYQDAISESSLRRQSSGLSWSSNKQRNSQDIDRKVILLKRHSAVSEDLEENENLFQSNFLDGSDVEYLEPIKK